MDCRRAIAAVLLACVGAATPAGADDDCQKLLPPGSSYPSISSTPPFDATFSANPTPSDLQKSFDLFSWASFVALNWPANADGTPMSGPITANPSAPRVWETYITPPQVFKPDGSAPDPWGGSNNFLEKVVAAPRKNQRVLFAAGKDLSNAASRLSGVQQASFGTLVFPPIADLNSKYVFYDIFFNRPEYDYIVANKLYNQNGQSAFLRSPQPPNTVAFPQGSNSSKTYGALEVKAAWKLLGDGDNPAQFYTITATMIDPVTGKAIPDQTFGLVGLHIITRTASAPQWIWSTFEQVNNAPDVKESNLKTQYNFNDPKAAQPQSGYAIKPSSPQPVANPKPTQITRVLNNTMINDPWTQCLNATMQAKLAGSVWANYRLVTTQWPQPVGNGPQFNAIPPSVTNTTMETYIQTAGPDTASCLSCHGSAQTSGTLADGKTNGSANFSYLLQTAMPVTTPGVPAVAPGKSRPAQ